jgi:hypothetical protein
MARVTLDHVIKRFGIVVAGWILIGDKVSPEGVLQQARPHAGASLSMSDDRLRAG